MQLKDVMTREVEVISPKASIEDAARKMDQLNVGPLPVLDRSKHLVGIVALGDLATDIRDNRVSGAVLEQVSERAQTNR